MSITRRKFLAVVPAAAGAVLSLKGTVLGQTGEVLEGVRVLADELSRLGWNDFHQFQNTEFVFSGLGVQNVPLTLAAMEDSRPAGKRKWGAGQECFVLKFTASRRDVLKQDTYDVSHFRLGDFRLFITPGPPSKREQSYYAVINRVTTS